MPTISQADIPRGCDVLLDNKLILREDIISIFYPNPQSYVTKQPQISITRRARDKEGEALYSIRTGERICEEIKGETLLLKQRSSRGRFYEKIIELDSVDLLGHLPIYERDYNTQPPKGATEMNTREAVTIMQLSNGGQIIRGEYIDNPAVKEYHFKNVTGEKIALGDIIVVETRDTYSVVKVTSVNITMAECPVDLGSLKHVVAKVDTRKIERIKKAEAEASHEIAMAEVHQKLNAYREAIGPGIDKAVSLLAINHQTPEEPENDTAPDIADEAEDAGEA